MTSGMTASWMNFQLGQQYINSALELCSNNALASIWSEQDTAFQQEGSTVISYAFDVDHAGMQCNATFNVVLFVLV